MKTFFWSAVLNGVIAVPMMMVVMLLLTIRCNVMGQFTIGPVLKVLGRLAITAMAAAAVSMFAT